MASVSFKIRPMVVALGRTVNRVLGNVGEMGDGGGGVEWFELAQNDQKWSSSESCVKLKLIQKWTKLDLKRPKNF